MLLAGEEIGGACDNFVKKEKRMRNKTSEKKFHRTVKGILQK
jgi:hypothetical protein